MPCFICPRCGTFGIVPLAISEAIIDDLAEKQRLRFVDIHDKRAVIPLSCNDCESICLHEQPLETGSQISIEPEYQQAFELLNDHLRGREYKTASIKDVYQLFDGGCIYTTVDARGLQACLVPKWIAR